MSRRTVLFENHVALGASMTDFAGWTMPVRYSSDIAEHNAVRSAAGLFDLSHMGEVEIVGPRAAQALDYSVVGTPSRIKPGRARYSMICDTDGGIIDDLVIYRLTEDRYLVVANASNVDSVVEALRDRAEGLADVRDASNEWALIAVQGPNSPDIVSDVTNADVDELKYYAIDHAELAGRPVYLARTGYTGEDGFEIYCKADDAPDVWATVLAAGGPRGLVPAGLACRDTLRLEAGMPLYGHELTRELTPYEAGLGRVVNLDKPRFAGREALLRRSRTKLSQTLVGLASTSRRSPRAGYSVIDPATDHAVGRVTSGAPSPTLGHGIAMAYVPLAVSAEGTQLEIDIRGSREDAVVVALPFYRRQP